MVVLSPGSRLASDLTTLEHDLAETLCELQMRTRALSFILTSSQLVKLAVSWSDKPENVQRCCFDSRMLMDGEEWEEWVEREGRAVLEGVAEGGPGGPPVVPSSQTRQRTNRHEARLERSSSGRPRPRARRVGWRTRWPLRTKIRPGAMDGGVNGMTGGRGSRLHCVALIGGSRYAVFLPVSLCPFLPLQFRVANAEGFVL